jgi:protein-S-isoprenylcysteine O-methyltransferase Ste14
MMTPALWIFLALTLAHVAPVLRTSYLQRRTAPGRTVSFRRSAGTAWIYLCFLGCWVPAVVRLYREGTLADPWTVSGIAVFAAGAALRAWSLGTLVGSYSAGVVLYEDHRLVTGGPYAVVRHPLHLGLMLEMTGMVLIGPGWTSGVLTAGLLAYLVLRGRLEDRLLLERFGEEAESYQRDTPAMIPRFRTGRDPAAR